MGCDTRGVVTNQQDRLLGGRGNDAGWVSARVQVLRG